MFNNFLSSLLQIVIILDVVGVVAYFVLIGLKPRPSDADATLLPPPTAGRSASASRSLGWRGALGFHRLRSRLGHLVPRRRARPRMPMGESLEAAFGRLHRVLNSYQEGLA